MKLAFALRRFLVAGTVVTTMAALGGCSDPPPPTGAFGLVVGGHANMPRPSLVGLAAKAADEAVESQAYLSMWIADGAPFLKEQGTLLADAANDVARQNQKDANRQHLDDAVDKAAAKAPETDLLAALDLAARSIKSRDGRHTIVVVDSGLSTQGAFDFRKPGLIDAETQELVDWLKRGNDLPDLSGDHVVFSGLGDTALPQKPLSHAQRVHLVDMWVAIVKAAGAIDVQVEQAPLQGEPRSGLPPVTPIDPGSVTCTAGTIKLSGGDVAFQPDSPEFLDPEGARAVLTPIAGRIQAEHLTAKLTGTTAQVGPDAGQIKLSRERAQAVADLLGQLGAPVDPSNVVGLGSHFDGYVPDHDAAGNLLPDKAAQNRKVIIQLIGPGAAVEC